MQSAKLKRLLRQVAALRTQAASLVTKADAIHAELNNELTSAQALGNASAAADKPVSSRAARKAAKEAKEAKPVPSKEAKPSRKQRTGEKLKTKVKKVRAK